MADDFGTAFGTRVRELREQAGITQDQLARAIGRTGVGVTWTRARVAQVESGSGIPDLGAIHAVALAISQLSSTPVHLADLLPDTNTSEVVQLWRDALTGAPVRGPMIGQVADSRLAPGWGAVEDKVAAHFGPGTEAFVLSAAHRLYGGRSGSQERDHRAGPGATPQRRGHASRAIISELVDATQREIDETAAQDATFETELRHG
ncbi:helix-turn-helix domain-containing protein [Tsukamurella soli]|uniref:helix-turn-helix domain-containing protein n=1 Tax=Tsukamurella soli TaxID=644556 RepID=UPI0031EAE9A1